MIGCDVGWRLEPLIEPLTDRELAVLRLLRGTLTLAEIAAELHVSANTVKTHTRSIFRKTGAHSRAEAVLLGQRLGLI